MKRFLLSAILRPHLIIATIASGSILTSFAGPDAVPSDDNEAKNLARMNCGAQIECITPDGRVAQVATAADQNESAAALITDDNTLSCPLKEGHTTFVIALPSASMLDRFTFVNENAAAAGDLKISVSNYRLPAASAKWTPVDGHVAFSHKRLFNLSMLGVEARYVKLDFTVDKPGRIAALGLYGAQSLDSFSQRNMHIVHDGIGGRKDGAMTVANTSSRNALNDTLNFDFANVYAHARVVYVSSGELKTARRMIDDDTNTAFKFAPHDPHPLAIVELAQAQRLHRVTALSSVRSGRLDVYTLNELRPEPGDLREAKLVATAVDNLHTGKAAIDFDPQGARYIAYRWTPDKVGDDAGQPFEVAEINAFGNVPLAMLDMIALPTFYASSLTTTSAPPTAGSVPIPEVPVLSP